MRGNLMLYRRIVEDDFKKFKLVPEDADLFEVIKNRNVPSYYSTYLYNEAAKEQFDKTGSVGGTTDVKTKMLWWDFDGKDLEEVQRSTQKLVGRLEALGFQEDNIKINFSGGKGFHVVVDIDKELSPAQVKAFAQKYANDLPGFDDVVYDPNRVLRAPLTRHKKSGLYCTPISLEELKTNTIDQIKQTASSIDGFDTESFNLYYKPGTLEDRFVPVIEEKTKKEALSKHVFDITTIDLKNRPKGFDEARWMLMNGFFRGSGSSDIGERNHALLCLASTLKAQGYDEALTVNILNGVTELQAQRTGEDQFPTSELENNIIRQVYSDNWRGGVFTTRDPNNWLAKYARKMGISQVEEDARVKSFVDTSENFGAYIANFENNPLKFGLPALDKAFPIPAGTVVGVVAAASAGKTLLALKLLENASRAGMVCVFASLDMSATRMFEKLLYRVTKGESRESIFESWKDPVKRKRLTKLVEEAYGNVFILNKSAATVDDIREYITKVEQQTGKPVEMVMIDYFERVNSEYSDETKASKMVAMQIQDIVNDMPAIRAVTLYQPSKFALGGGPDNPILSYTAIKGSSAIFQSCRQILSLWRDFQSPEFKEYDRFMRMAILKNDLGELDMFTYGFSGKKGEVYEMEDIEHQEFQELLKMKENLKNGKEDAWS